MNNKSVIINRVSCFVFWGIMHVLIGMTQFLKGKTCEVHVCLICNKGKIRKLKTPIFIFIFIFFIFLIFNFFRF